GVTVGRTVWLGGGRPANWLLGRRGPVEVVPARPARLPAPARSCSSLRPPLLAREPLTHARPAHVRGAGRGPPYHRVRGSQDPLPAHPDAAKPEGWAGLVSPATGRLWAGRCPRTQPDRPAGVP